MRRQHRCPAQETGRQQRHTHRSRVHCQARAMDSRSRNLQVSRMRPGCSASAGAGRTLSACCWGGRSWVRPGPPPSCSGREPCRLAVDSTDLRPSRFCGGTRTAGCCGRKGFGCRRSYRILRSKASERNQDAPREAGRAHRGHERARRLQEALTNGAPVAEPIARLPIAGIQCALDATVGWKSARPLAICPLPAEADLAHVALVGAVARVAPAGPGV